MRGLVLAIALIGTPAAAQDTSTLLMQTRLSCLGNSSDCEQLLSQLVQSFDNDIVALRRRADNQDRLIESLERRLDIQQRTINKLVERATRP